MLLEAIGAGLPAAMAVALSPFPIVGIVLVLAGRHALVAGPLFAAGWLAGLAAVSVLVMVVLGGSDDPDSGTAAIADWGRVVAGAALIIGGVRKWAKRPRAGSEIAPPSWMASLDSVSPSRALVLGLGLAGANPKNFVLAVRRRRRSPKPDSMVPSRSSPWRRSSCWARSPCSAPSSSA